MNTPTRGAAAVKLQTATASEIEVNWQLVLPLILVASIGTVLLLWRRRRSPPARR
jgi:hypothetical protein